MPPLLMREASCCRVGRRVVDPSMLDNMANNIEGTEEVR